MKNAFFEQITIDDLNLPDVIVLSDGGDWCYLKDFLLDRMADSCLLRRMGFDPIPEYVQNIIDGKGGKQ
jgi:hypothetical protein